MPLLNAKESFLSNRIKIEFGTAQGFGKGADIDEEPPDFGTKACGVFETKSLATLSESLRKVKWEVSGIYKRYASPQDWPTLSITDKTESYDLSSILVDGMCHWKY